MSATIYTVQVSDHPEAHLRIPTEAAAQSWRTIYDGPLPSPGAAQQRVNELSRVHACVRVFKGGVALGKFHYGVFRPAT
jgi:hypothetical protein